MTALRTRMLAQVLAESETAPPRLRAFFYDEATLRMSARQQDRLLYTAERDVHAPRTVRLPDGDMLTWRLDRVHYPAGDLPSGELNRSVGHWNPQDQWEIFSVEQGEVAVVVTSASTGRVDVVHCTSGEVACVRPGSWHLTYVLEGPAVVANLYCEPGATGQRNGRADQTAKYFTRPAVRVGLLRTEGQPEVFADCLNQPVKWERGQDSGDVLGSAESFDAILTGPDRHDLLIDPPRLFARLFPAR
jgi:oxalate decarboxylase/phosphoglucose isomerase-like protein (cupin superfamily)